MIGSKYLGPTWLMATALLGCAGVVPESTGDDSADGASGLPGGKADLVDVGPRSQLETFQVPDYVRCTGAASESAGFFGVDAFQCEASSWDGESAVRLQRVSVKAGGAVLHLEHGASGFIQLRSDDVAYPLTLAMAAEWRDANSKDYTTETRIVVESREELSTLNVSAAAPFEIWQVAYYPSEDLRRAFENGELFQLEVRATDVLPLETEQISVYSGRTASTELEVYARRFASDGRQTVEDGLMAISHILMPANADALSAASSLDGSETPVTLHGSGYYVMHLDGTLSLATPEELPVYEPEEPRDNEQPVPEPVREESIATARSLACEVLDPRSADASLAAVGEDGALISIGETNLGRAEQCDAAVADARPVEGSSFVCLPLENDGHYPWVIAIIDEALNVTRIPYALGDYDDCTSALSAMIEISPEDPLAGMTTCGSRDNDGRAPFIMIAFGRDWHDPVYGEFDALESCLETIE